MGDEPGSVGGTEFGRRLSALEREGATFLVVGAAPEEAHTGAGSNLLRSAGERRRRLVTLVGTDPDRVGRLLSPDHPRDPEHLRVIHHPVSDRSGSSVTDGGPEGPSSALPSGVASPSDGPGIGDGGTGVDRTVEGGLPELGTAIVESVDAFEAISGGLDPGELRICVDSLTPLVAEHGKSAVYRFLHLLTERVRRSGALAFFHLSADPDGEAATMLASLFDGRIELRVRDGQTQQRWHLDDASSGWIPVEECPGE